MAVAQYRSILAHPREDVYRWHARPGSLVRGFPPGLMSLTRRPSNGLADGSNYAIRIGVPAVTALLELGGLKWRPGVDLTLRYTDVEPDRGFAIAAIDGPLRYFRHDVRLTDLGPGRCQVTDTVEWHVGRGNKERDALLRSWVPRLLAYRHSQLIEDLALHARLDATPSRVVVAGASGLIGTQLQALLESGGHQVIQLVRGKASRPDQLHWDPANGQLSPGALDGADAVVNLSGRSIGGRFNSANKAAILDSRLQATTTLVEALRRSDSPAALVQASAIGYYGPKRPGELLTERSGQGEGFLAEVVRQWEAAAEPAAAFGARVAYLRTGIVLSQAGGMLASQLPLFVVGLGGPLADADAMVSWISLDDMARAYLHTIFTPAAAGPLNAVAPEPVTMREFAHSLGSILRRPARVPLPKLGARVALGAEGHRELIETDQRVSSAALQATGFNFAQPLLEHALGHILLWPANSHGGEVGSG